MKEYRGKAVVNEKGYLRVVYHDVPEGEEGIGEEHGLKQVPCKIMVDESKEAIKKMYDEYDSEEFKKGILKLKKFLLETEMELLELEKEIKARGKQK